MWHLHWHQSVFSRMLEKLNVLFTNFFSKWVPNEVRAEQAGESCTRLCVTQPVRFSIVWLLTRWFLGVVKTRHKAHLLLTGSIFAWIVRFKRFTEEAHQWQLREAVKHGSKIRTFPTIFVKDKRQCLRTSCLVGLRSLFINCRPAVTLGDNLGIDPKMGFDPHSETTFHSSQKANNNSRLVIRN